MAYFTLWLTGASALLFVTWNQVIAHVASVKKVKYWQALLFLATLAALCAPKIMAHKHHACKGQNDCGSHHREMSGAHGEGGGAHEKAPCPYEKKAQEAK